MKRNPNIQRLLLAIAVSLAFPLVASASHCREVRASYGHRIKALEISYRNERRANS